MNKDIKLYPIYIFKDGLLLPTKQITSTKDYNHYTHNFLVSKNFLENTLLKSYKTQDEDLCEMIKLTYKQGELWELPEFVKLSPYGKKYFIYDENYEFDYDFIKLFYSIHRLLGIKFYIVKHYGTPTIKVFIDNKFAGIFMTCKIRK